MSGSDKPIPTLLTLSHGHQHRERVAPQGRPAPVLWHVSGVVWLRRPSGLRRGRSGLASGVGQGNVRGQ